MKIAVHTVIIGNYDVPKPFPDKFREEADFFLITGDGVVYEDPRKESRRSKILSHTFFPDYDYTVYIDGSIEMAESPVFLVEKYLKEHDIALFKHPYRYGIYEEADCCVAIGVAEASLVARQMAFYMEEGYPWGNGLTENCVLIRRNCEDITKLNELWWKIYSEYPTRDQLSFCYSAWKLGIKYNHLDLFSINSTEFKLYPHS